jgi:predicted Zn-dependent protease
MLRHPPKRTQRYDLEHLLPEHGMPLHIASASTTARVSPAEPTSPAGRPFRHRLLAPLAVLAFTLTAGGCAHVTPEQEVDMGAQYANEIAKQLPLISDPEVVRYINVLGDSIASVTARRDLDWHFYVVDSREVNAFAVPGGYIYVNRGLIERTEKMHELAGVLGHEIGHVVKRHSVKQMEKAQGANLGITLGCILTGVCGAPGAGDVINIGANAVFAKFSRADETEADVEGFHYVVRAGINPQGIVTMFQRLIQERQVRPSGVATWFATHPLEEDRIANVQRMINQIPAAQRANLTEDSQNYQRFKRRLQSLPPSPQPRQQ